MPAPAPLLHKASEKERKKSNGMSGMENGMARMKHGMNGINGGIHACKIEKKLCLPAQINDRTEKIERIERKKKIEKGGWKEWNEEWNVWNGEWNKQKEKISATARFRVERRRKRKE